MKNANVPKCIFDLAMRLKALKAFTVAFKSVESKGHGMWRLSLELHSRGQFALTAGVKILIQVRVSERDPLVHKNLAQPTLLGPCLYPSISEPTALR